MDTLELEENKGPPMDEMAQVKGEGAKLDIAANIELDIVGLVSTAPIKT